MSMPTYAETDVNVITVSDNLDICNTNELGSTVSCTPQLVLTPRGNQKHFEVLPLPVRKPSDQKFLPWVMTGEAC